MKLYCNKCKGETNHEVIKSHRVQYRDDYNCDEEYAIVSCAGCDSISFQKVFYDYESGYFDVTLDEYTYDEDVTQYPKPYQFRENLEIRYPVPNIIRQVYSETKNAIRNELFILSGIGFRSTIEAICHIEKIEGRDLSKKIDNMIKKGVVSKVHGNILHSLRFLGNDSAHEMNKPTIQQCGVAISVLENIINSLYVYPNEAKEHLETIIEDVDALVKHLKTSIKTKNKDLEYTFKDLLGKEYRRLSDAKQLEKDFYDLCSTNSIDFINIGQIDEIDDGANKTRIQFYKIV